MWQHSLTMYESIGKQIEDIMHQCGFIGVTHQKQTLSYCQVGSSQISNKYYSLFDTYFLQHGYSIEKIETKYVAEYMHVTYISVQHITKIANNWLYCWSRHYKEKICYISLFHFSQNRGGIMILTIVLICFTFKCFLIIPFFSLVAEPFVFFLLFHLLLRSSIKPCLIRSKSKRESTK